jgi:hypothetical protein
LFSGNPSTWPTLWTGAKIALTSASSSRSIGSAAQVAQSRMLAGLALPAIVVAISGFSRENWSASLAIGVPRARQAAAALRAASFTLSGSLSQTGSAASVRSRALNGPAFMTPIPRSTSHGTVSSAKRVFWRVYWL